MSSMQNFPFFFVLIMMVHSIETARINERHLQVKYKYCAYTYYMYHDSPTAFEWERKNRESERWKKNFRPGASHCRRRHRKNAKAREKCKKRVCLRIISSSYVSHWSLLHIIMLQILINVELHRQRLRRQQIESHAPVR